MRKEHEEAVETLVQEWVSFGFEELETEVCEGVSLLNGTEVDGNIHVNTGDSKSWTSLSICMSMLTVISSSALPLVSTGRFV